MPAIIKRLFLWFRICMCCFWFELTFLFLLIALKLQCRDRSTGCQHFYNSFFHNTPPKSLLEAARCHHCQDLSIVATGWR